MAQDPAPASPFRCTIAPWLTVGEGERAVAFYKSAFGATEVDRLDVPGRGVVARLSVDGAEFWLSAGSPDANTVRIPMSGPIRMVLTVEDPDAVFARAIEAGATEVVPVGEAHGWRFGRLTDPFGHDWEVGRPLETISLDEVDPIEERLV